MEAKKEHAYVWQDARFKGDVKYCVKKIGPHAQAQAVNDGRALRFYLTAEGDFENFLDAVQRDLGQVEFQGSGDLADLEGEE